MPVDSILVSAVVVSVFAVFAGVLIWGDFLSGRCGSDLSTAIESAAASDHVYGRMVAAIDFSREDTVAVMIQINTPAFRCCQVKLTLNRGP